MKERYQKACVQALRSDEPEESIHNVRVCVRSPTAVPNYMYVLYIALN